MPYIAEREREILDDAINQVISKLINIDTLETQRGGLLNYIITRIVLASMKNDIRYSKINDIIGALQCVQLELYRRLVGDYEDTKIASNGDVKEYIDLGAQI